MKLDDFGSVIEKILSKQSIFAFAWAFAILVVGFFLARKLSNAVARIGSLEIQQRVFFQKATYVLLVTLVIVTALNQIGFDLKVLLGAAGVLTVAIGFAAQTSASNLISGLFLIADRPFIIGDLIEVGGNKGEVLSMDLLSVKIRTFDNLMVRVPNETMVKSDIKNFSAFPVRRIDIKLAIAYVEVMARVHDLLYDVATRNPMVLDEPQPLFIFEGFSDSAMNIQFSVWSLTDNLLLTQNSIMQEIKTAFEHNGVQMAHPRTTMILGEPPKPLTEAQQAFHAQRARLHRHWLHKGDDGGV